MQSYDVEITYSHDGDIYITPYQVQAKDAATAEEIARGMFAAQNVFDDIKDVSVNEIPLGI